MFDDIFSPLDTIHEHERRQGRRTTMAGQWWMTQTAAGNENGGGLQTVDNIRRWRTMMMAEADDGDDGLRMTMRMVAAADDMK